MLEGPRGMGGQITAAQMHRLPLTRHGMEIDEIQGRVGQLQQPVPGRTRIGHQFQAQPVSGCRVTEIQIAVSGHRGKPAGHLRALHLVDGELARRILKHLQVGPQGQATGIRRQRRRAQGMPDRRNDNTGDEHEQPTNVTHSTPLQKSVLVTNDPTAPARKPGMVPPKY